MKKIVLASLFLAVAGLISGCRTSNVEVTYCKSPRTLPEGEVVAFLHGDNSCYYLFNLIPVWCGNPARPNTGDYYVFADRLSELRNEAMLQKVAKDIKADQLVDLKHKRYSSGWNTLGLVWTDVIVSTATATKKP